MSQNPPPPWPHGSPPPDRPGWPFQPVQPPPDAPGAAPRQPVAPPQLGSQPPPRVSIDDFKPQRRVAPVLVIAITVLLVAAAVVAAVFWSAQPPSPAASPTPAHSQPAPTSTRTPVLPGQGVDWESGYDAASGWWEITQESWQADGVVLTVRVTVDKGNVLPAFYVFDNTSSAQYRAEYSRAPAPTFPTNTLSATNTYEGNIFIAMPHAEGTLIMVSAHQVDAISALPIKA